MNWQPIETAPDDDSPVLVWHHNGYAVVVSWDDGWRSFFGPDGAYDSVSLTHWATITPPGSADE